MGALLKLFISLNLLPRSCAILAPKIRVGLAFSPCYNDPWGV